MTEPTRIGVLAAQLAERHSSNGQQPPAMAERAAKLEAELRTMRERQEAEQRAAVVADECDRGFPVRYRDASPEDPEVYRWAESYAENPRRAPSLLLLGPTGVGKTWAAYGALRMALTVRPPAVRRNSYAAVTAADMYASLRPRPGIDTEAVMDGYRAAPLLLLDDLGIAKGSEWTEETLYRLLNHRYEWCRPLIATTNLPLADLREALGARITSRLAENCTRIVLEGTDRRRGER